MHIISNIWLRASSWHFSLKLLSHSFALVKNVFPLKTQAHDFISIADILPVV